MRFFVLGGSLGAEGCGDGDGPGNAGAGDEADDCVVVAWVGGGEVGSFEAEGGLVESGEVVGGLDFGIR